MFTKVAAASVFTTIVSSLSAPLQTSLFLQDSLAISQGPTQLKFTPFTQVPCQYLYDYSYYQLVNVSNPLQFYTTNESLPEVAYYDICQDLSQTNVTNCSGPSYASIEIAGLCALNATNVPTATTLNGNFAIQFTNTDSATNGGVSQLTVELICDSSATTAVSGPLTPVANTTTYTTTLTSSTACPIFTYNAFIQFIDQYKVFWGIAFMVLGIFLAFFGRYLLKAAVFIAGTILIAFIILVVFYATFLSDKTASWVGWLVVSLAIILGLIGGYLLQKYEKVDAALLGAWGGFTLGVLLNETVLYLVHSTALFWCVNIGLAVVGALIGFFAFNPVIMIGTAFIGSYLTMRGISLYAGGFPNEYVLINQIKSGATQNIDPAFYGYLAGIFVMTILASIVQFKMFKRMEEHQKHPYNKLN